MFENKTALIYGGARGIGRAVALEFAGRGSRVAIADLDSDGAQEAAAAIVALGGEAVGLRCDVSDDLAVREAADAAELALGAVDIVVNNVGALLHGYPEDIPLTEWERMFSLNLFSVLRSNDVFVPKMIARGSGHIVNTSTFAGLYPFAISRMPYAASKAAVIALSENMAIHLHPKGVRVSCFCPGPVATGITAGMKSWSQDAVMVGPGSDYAIKSAEEVAAILADGMRDGRIIISSDEAVWQQVRLHAADPDAFIQRKIDEFARGEEGRPRSASPEGARALAELGHGAKLPPP